MNPVEVGAVAYDAGIRDTTDLATAIAIAMAESGGNPRAHNTRPPDNSYGLWQINMYGNLGPQRRAQFGIASDDALFDPMTNAKAMMAISGGGKNWKPWSTYKGARYYIFLPNATAIAPGVITARGGQAIAGEAKERVDSVTDAAQAGVGQFLKAGHWLADRNNWFRIAKGVVGANLIIGAIIMMAVPGGLRTAMKVVPVGKAGKILGGAK
jgi:lysozyme-like protein